MDRIGKYTAIQNCSMDLPTAYTGRPAKEVFEDAEKNYQQLKIKEAKLEGLGKYDTLTEEENEFIDAYLDKLNEFSKVCGGSEKIETQSNQQSSIKEKIEKIEKAIRGAETALKYSKDEEKNAKMKKAINGAELALKTLKKQL